MKRLNLKAKLLLILALFVVAPLFVVGYIRLLEIQNLLEESIRETGRLGDVTARLAYETGERAVAESERHLRELVSQQLRGAALETANKLSKALEGGEITPERFRADPAVFDIVSKQFDGEGFVLVLDRGGVMLFNPLAPEFEGRHLSLMAESNPELRRLLARSLDSDETVQGYYDWAGPDGVKREKRLVLAPAPNLGIRVGITVHTRVYGQPIDEMKSRLGRRFDEMAAAIKRESDDSIRELKALMRANLRRTLITGGITTIVALLVFLIVMSSVIAPLHQLNRAVRGLQDGQWSPDTPLPGNRSDEIGVLARSLKAMADQLREREMELTAKNHELEHNAESLAESNKVLLRLKEQVEGYSHELEKTNAAKTMFLSTVSHELRTPLTLILGYLSLMLEGKFGELNERQQKGLKVSVRRARYIQRLISDLLDLSRIESGEVALDFNPLDVGAATAIVIEELASLAEEKRIAVHERIKPDLPRIVADQDKFHQILSNLVKNAVKYTPEGGEVTVSAGLEGDRIRVSVRDTGIGISPEDQQDIFERFHQVKGVERGEERGSGLGLAIVKETLELLGGEVGLESEPGQGSCFWFTLPLDAPAGWEPGPEWFAAPEPRPDGQAHGIEGKRILVIDDDPDLLFLIKDILEQDGVEIRTAADGLQGLDMVFSQPVDVILLDVMMPRMDGFEVCRFLKGHPKTAGIPIILVTGAGQEAQIKQGFAAGADAYIVKPFSIDKLRNTVFEILTGRGA